MKESTIFKKDDLFEWCFKDFLWAPIRLIYETSVVYVRILGWKDTAIHLFLQTTALLTLNYISYSVFRQYNVILNNTIMGLYNVLSCDAQKEEMCHPMDMEAWEKFESAFLPIVPLVALNISIATVQYAITKYSEVSLSRKIVDSLNAKKFSKQVAYSIQSSNERMLNNIFTDAIIFGESNELVMSAFLSIQNAIMVLSDLIKMSSLIPIYSNIYIPDIAAYFLLYGFATNFITQSIVGYKVQWHNKLEFLKLELRTTQSHYDKNIGVLTLLDGEKEALSRQAAMVSKIRDTHNSLLYWGAGLKLWQILNSSIYGVAKYYLFGWKVFSQTLLYEYRWTIYETLHSIEKAFSWTNENSDKMTKIGKVGERISLFLEEVDKICKKEKDSVMKLTHNASSIILNKVSISVGGKTLCKNLSYEFRQSRKYLMSMKSGKGKSTFLKFLKSGVSVDDISSVGSITYPEGRKLIMLPQDTFFPHKATVLESLYYPDLPENDMKKQKEFLGKAVDLLSRIAFTDLVDINSLMDKDVSSLSGGQKKKIQIVSAIMKKPDILLLDETFNGLDEISKDHVLQLIEREIPKATMIVIDHNHSSSTFYDKILKEDFFCRSI